LTPAARAEPWYVFQTMFHGSTAPGFLFASGFVAGLPRAPLSLKASLRRARRLLFVLGVGYFLHLPYASLWKTLAAASPAEKAALFACHALQVIAVTQLVVTALQGAAGRRWPTVGAFLGVLILVLVEAACLRGGRFVSALGLLATRRSSSTSCTCSSSSAGSSATAPSRPGTRSSASRALSPRSAS